MSFLRSFGHSFKLSIFMLMLAGCEISQLPEAVSDTFGQSGAWILETFTAPASREETPAAEVAAKPNPTDCGGKADCAPERSGESCDHLQPGPAESSKRRALILGRLAVCLEASGQNELAAEARRQQQVLHREHGSILYPASYYRGGHNGKGVARIVVRDPTQDCVSVVQPPRAKDPACPDCFQPIALHNLCDTPVHIGYCLPAATSSKSADDCLQFQSTAPGEVIAIVARPSDSTASVITFRSLADWTQWAQSAGH